MLCLEPTPQFKGEAGGSPGQNKEETSGVAGRALGRRRKAAWGCRWPALRGSPAAALPSVCIVPAGWQGQVGVGPCAQSGGPDRPGPSQPLCPRPVAQPRVVSDCHSSEAGPAHSTQAGAGGGWVGGTTRRRGQAWGHVSCLV